MAAGGPRCRFVFAAAIARVDIQMMCGIGRLVRATFDVRRAFLRISGLCTESGP